MEVCTCEKCGNPVRYQAVSGGRIITLDTELKELYTVHGYKAQGYSVHICKGKDNGHERDFGQ